MTENQNVHITATQDVGVLDVLVTLAANVKLLVIGPLLAGLCAVGISMVWPQTYESVAVLQADPLTARLMTTPAVLDPVAVALGLTKNQTVEAARTQLQGAITATVGRTDKLLTLTVSDRTAQQAQAIAKAVIAQTYQESRPKAAVRGRLEAQLADAQLRLKSAQDAAANQAHRMELAASSPTSIDLGSGYATLLGIVAAAQTEIRALQVQLDGLNDALLVQAPTLPEVPSQPRKRRLVVGAVVVTALLLLVFVFMRQALRVIRRDPENADKLASIRGSLGLK